MNAKMAEMEAKLKARIQEKLREAEEKMKMIQEQQGGIQGQLNEAKEMAQANMPEGGNNSKLGSMAGNTLQNAKMPTVAEVKYELQSSLTGDAGHLAARFMTKEQAKWVVMEPLEKDPEAINMFWADASFKKKCGLCVTHKVVKFEEREEQEDGSPNGDVMSSYLAVGNNKEIKVYLGSEEIEDRVIAHYKVPGCALCWKPHITLLDNGGKKMYFKYNAKEDYYTSKMEDEELKQMFILKQQLGDSLCAQICAACSPSKLLACQPCKIVAKKMCKAKKKGMCAGKGCCKMEKQRGKCKNCCWKPCPNCVWCNKIDTKGQETDEFASQCCRWIITFNENHVYEPKLIYQPKCCYMCKKLQKVRFDPKQNYNDRLMTMALATLL